MENKLDEYFLGPFLGTIICFASLSMFITSCVSINNLTTKEVKRPINVPSEATYRDGQWLQGKISKRGFPMGAFSVWNDDGTLMHDAQFDKVGNIIWLKSYFPNGQVGRAIQYNSSQKRTHVLFRGYRDYCDWLITPIPIGDQGYATKDYAGKLRYDNAEIFNGTTEGYTFYDENHTQLYTASAAKYTDLQKKYLEKPMQETWPNAILRLEKYAKELYALLASEGHTDYEDYFSISFSGPVDSIDIVDAEKRLNILLPASYKSFLLEKGLMHFGVNNNEQKMVHPKDLNTIEAFLDPNREGLYKGYFRKNQALRDSLIVFFVDQEDYQYEGWIGFDCSDEMTESAIIENLGCKNIPEWEEFLGHQELSNTNAMNEFVSNYVDKLISEREP